MKIMGNTHVLSKHMKFVSLNTKEKSNSKTKVETNYVWTKPQNWLEMIVHALTTPSKNETKS